VLPQSFKSIEVAQASWCDVQLYSFEWENLGRDFKLNFVGWTTSNSKDKAMYSLRCSWASSMEMNLKFKDMRGGLPMTWDASFEQVENGSWNVLFDFASCGKISFHCSEIELELSPPSTT